MNWPTKACVVTALLVAALIAAGGALANAQETTGTITGTVTDQTGAVLPGVTVSVKRVETGRAQDFVSNEAGRYTATALEPGTYEVTFNLSGFQPVTVKAIELHVNDRLEVSGKLGVGQVSETVVVSAASQFVQPTPAVQTLMGPTQVQELPLNNRNFVQLATLVPGVSSDLSDEVGVGLTSTVSLSINGGRRNAVNWLVDGVSNVDVGSNVTLLSTPTLESIQEFKIITSSYQAEWPRSGGGIVNVVTKSGSSQFTGSAYEFFRNDKLNANTFFRNLSSNPEISGNAPQLRYNNFGYTAGGPLLPSRQKAFFFFSEEWRRIKRAPGNATVNAVNPEWLTDPANANYVAPEDRDPNAMKLLALFPAPNAFVGSTARFVNSVPNVNNTRQEVVRADYDLNNSWKLTGRYTHDLSETVEPQGLFNSATAFLPNISATRTQVPGQVAAFELRTNRGRWLNELKYQFSSNRIHTLDDPDNRNLRSDLALTIPELFPENNAGRIPSVSITGVQGWTTIQVFNIEYNNSSIVDNLTYQLGSHTFKTGLMFAFEQKNENANNQTQGSFAFVAGGGRTAFQNFLTGNRDGLCGTGCTYSEAQIDVTNHLRFNRYEMFAQDTWRVRPNVTLDYGVRYALYPALIDKNNILSTFDPALYNRAAAPDCANATCTALVPGTGDPLNGIIVAGINSPFGRAIYATDKNNVQPRVGISWDPRGDGQTVVRAAYGLYYDQPLVGIFEQNAFTNPPYVNTVSIQNASLSDPSSGQAPGTQAPRRLIATSVPFDSPRTQQWNIGVQRQIYRRGAIDVSYVGSRGDDLIQPLDINYPQPADVVAANGAVNLAVPYPGYAAPASITTAGITMRQTTAYSNYWGLLTQFRHEGGRAGTYTLNYTLSRNRTTASNDRDSVDFPQNPLDLDAEYADARTDRRHIFNATYVLELPFFRESPNQVLKATLGGWQVSGLTTLQSGPPAARVTVNVNGFRRGGRADMVGDPGAGDQNNGLYWIDPAAFAPPADGTYGNSPRAPFRLPGRNQTDLAISKNFYPMARRLQFRADLINAFNHTQFTTVDTACGVSLTTCVVAGDTFGTVTAARAPREVQLSLKLYW
jgi:hypothetical protein